MKTKGLTKFHGLNERITSFSHYNEQIGIGDLEGMSTSPIENMNDLNFSDALIVIHATRGSATVYLDYERYELKPDNLMIVLPIHVMQIGEVSLDFRGKLLIVQKSLVEECNCAESYFSVSNYMSLRKNPYLSFQQGENIYLDKCLQEIREKIELQSHAFHQEVIKNVFCAYVLELAHQMNQKKRTKNLPVLSRKEDLVHKFFQLIIRHCKIEHTTSFYAGKLCITPQYLSSILKDMTGKPANQWITDALITEAKIELRKPQVTVQEVAYTLNFSDQSSFGKFFKKGIGLSPSQYRIKEVG